MGLTEKLSSAEALCGHTACIFNDEAFALKGIWCGFFFLLQCITEKLRNFKIGVARVSGCTVEQRVRPINLCCVVVGGLSWPSLSRSASCSNDDCFLSKYDTEVLDDTLTHTHTHTPQKHRQRIRQSENLTHTVSDPRCPFHSCTHTQAFAGHYSLTAGVFMID